MSRRCDSKVAGTQTHASEHHSQSRCARKIRSTKAPGAAAPFPASPLQLQPACHLLRREEELAELRREKEELQQRCLEEVRCALLCCALLCYAVLCKSAWLPGGSLELCMLWVGWARPTPSS